MTSGKLLRDSGYAAEEPVAERQASRETNSPGIYLFNGRPSPGHRNPSLITLCPRGLAWYITRDWPLLAPVPRLPYQSGTTSVINTYLQRSYRVRGSGHVTTMNTLETRIDGWQDNFPGEPWAQHPSLASSPLSPSACAVNLLAGPQASWSRPLGSQCSHHHLIASFGFFLPFPSVS